MPTGEFHCGFEDGNICLFTQDDTDNFDWTKQSTATRNTKYTPNTGPNADRSGSKEGMRVWNVVFISTIHQPWTFRNAIMLNMKCKRMFSYRFKDFGIKHEHFIYHIKYSVISKACNH